MLYLNKQDKTSMAQHGGVRKGAGRKSRDEEQTLIEKLKPHDDEAIQMLITLVKKGDLRAVQLFMGYRYGKPKESVEVQNTGDVINLPLIQWVKSEEKEEGDKND